MPKPLTRVEAGTTVQFTWVASSNPSSLYLSVRDQAGLFTNTVAGVSSGTGNWYAFMTITDVFTLYPQVMMATWTAVSSTHASSVSPFISKMLFQVIKTAPWNIGGLG